MPDNYSRHLLALVVGGGSGAGAGAGAGALTQSITGNDGQIGLAASLGSLVGTVVIASLFKNIADRQQNNAQNQANDGIPAQVIPAPTPEATTHHRIEEGAGATRA